MRCVALRARYAAWKITFAALIAATALNVCQAGELDVSVVDTLGRGVGGAVVTVASAEKHPHAHERASAVMDQRNLAFVPRVLVIAVGTAVEFPNSDTVSHQVYSFSDAKKFHLPLYKGERHPPVTFDRAGLVVVGCNIHDQMAGYIYVTDAPFFGKTDIGGFLRLPNLPAGDFRITVWSPMIADSSETLVRNVHVDAREVTAEQVRLTRSLRTQPEPRPRRGDWEY